MAPKLREIVLALRTIWDCWQNGTKLNFKGTFYRFDLMTPYYTSDRMRNLMRLDPSTADRVTVQHFDGGHMFYAWQESRRAFSAAIEEFVADATTGA